MVEARQRNLRAFIFVSGEEEETIAYIQKHFVLLKDFLMVFTYPIGSGLLEFLQSQNLSFIEQTNSPKILSKAPKSQNPQESTQKAESAKPTESAQENLQENHNNQEIQEKEEKEAKTPTLILHRTIRSGEEILSQGDVTIFGRVNSGACIHAQGNVQIFGEISGNVFCNGAYMILGPIKEGNILFDGEIIERERLSQGYQKIYKKDNQIIIEDLL